MGNITINDVCELFDLYEIVDAQMQIDRDYYASTDAIYTDGKYEYNVTRDAYIHITSVKNATFIMFLNMENEIYLCIYKYIPEEMFKIIKQKLQFLKNKISEIDYTTARISGNNESNDNNIIDDFIDDSVIDINSFTCTECGSKEKLIFIRSKNNPEVLITKCNTCKT